MNEMQSTHVHCNSQITSMSKTCRDMDTVLSSSDSDLSQLFLEVKGGSTDNCYLYIPFLQLDHLYLHSSVEHMRE